MIGPCESGTIRSHQLGAALIVALSVTAAVALLAAAAMREAIVETATTGHLAAQVSARHAAVSALESVLAEDSLPSSGMAQRALRLGPAEAFEVTVSIVMLGESVGRHAATPEAAATTWRHFELTAEATGPRNARHRRRLYLHIPLEAEVPNG